MAFRLYMVLPLLAFLCLFCASEDEPINNNLDIVFQKNTGISSVKDLDCLSNFTNYVESFLQGQTSEDKIKSFWGCMAYSVGLYAKYAETNAQGEYPARDIRNFLSHYFWSDGEFPQGLMSEIMNLKVVLVGGEANEFSSEEFQLLQSFLVNDMGALSLKLLPDIKIIGSGVLVDKLEGIDEERFNDALENFRWVMGDFGEVFSRNHKQYELTSLMNFFVELQPLFTYDNPDSLFTNVDKLMPVIVETKALLVGPNRKFIQSTEWSEFFGLLANAYAVWLRSVNYIQGQDISQGTALSQFYLIIDEVVTYLKVGVRKQANGVYQHSDAYRLLTALEGISSLPFGVDVGLVKSLWEFVVDKIFRPEFDAPQIEGLTIKKLVFFQSQFYNWYDMQKRLAAVAGKEIDIEDPGLGEMARVFSALPNSLNFDENKRLVLPNNSKVYSQSSLTFLNVERMLVQLLMRAYATDEERRRNFKYINLSELESLVGDIKEATSNLGFLDPNDEGFARRVYRDTSLFLPRSNGNELIEFAEGLEFIHYVISGWATNKLIEKEIEYSCKKGFDKDQQRVETNCFRGLLLKNSDHFFGNLPIMKNYMNSLSKQQWNIFTGNLERTVSGTDIVPGYIRLSDIFEMTVLLHYMETLMLKYDLDGNQTLNLSETDKFLEKNLKIIGALTGIDPEYGAEQIRIRITYILKFNRSYDDENDLVGDLRFDYWKDAQKHWAFEANRLSLSFVLAILGN